MKRKKVAALLLTMSLTTLSATTAITGCGAFAGTPDAQTTTTEKSVKKTDDQKKDTDTTEISKALKNLEDEQLALLTDDEDGTQANADTNKISEENNLVKTKESDSFSAKSAEKTENRDSEENKSTASNNHKKPVAPSKESSDAAEDDNNNTEKPPVIIEDETPDHSDNEEKPNVDADDTEKPDFDDNEDAGDKEDPDTGDTENPDTGDTEDPDTGDTEDPDTGDTEDPDIDDGEECNHKWVDNMITVKVDEVGHYETVIKTPAWTEEINHPEQSHTEYVNHPEEFHYEQKWVYQCNGCGTKFDSDEAVRAHSKEQMMAGNVACGGFKTYTENVKVVDKEAYTEEIKVVDQEAWTEYIEHEAEYEEVWIVDQEAHTEIIKDGQICENCGEWKK